MAVDVSAWYAAVLLAGAAVFWTWRLSQGQLERQREEVARIQHTAERLLQAKSLREIDDMLRRGFTDSRLTIEAKLYFYRRTSRELETLEGEAVDIHSPQEGAPSLIATTFRNRVAVFTSDSQPGGYLVPMLAGEESNGVVLFSGAGLLQIGLPSLQFLASHAAVAARAIEQLAWQEQLFRHEKLATAAQFVQAVAMELREVAEESPRAQGLVDRLLAMGRAEAGDARPVHLASLLNGIFADRRPAWRERQIDDPVDLEENDALQVLGSHHQLEQVFVALLESAESLRPPAIEVTAGIRSRRARVEIRFSPVLPGSPLPDARRGLVQATLRAMGAELVVAETLPVRFEVELPLCTPVGSLRGETAGESRTALVVEQDPTQRWQLVQLVAQRGIRVVPAESVADALDRFEQFDFDIVFCPWQNGRPDAMRLLEHVLLTSRPVQTFVVAETEESGMEATVEGRAVILRKPVRDVSLFPLLPAS